MSRDLVTLAQATKARPWLTERFLRRLVAERRIAFHKAGGKLLFDLADIDDFAEAGRVEPPRATARSHQDRAVTLTNATRPLPHENGAVNGRRYQPTS